MRQDLAIEVLAEIQKNNVLNSAKHVSLNFDDNLDTSIIIHSKLNENQKKKLGDIVKKKQLNYRQISADVWIIP